jgi:hypothetical protein
VVLYFLILGVLYAHLDVTLLRLALRHARIVASVNIYQMPQLMPLSTTIQTTVVSAHLDGMLLRLALLLARFVAPEST